MIRLSINRGAPCSKKRSTKVRLFTENPKKTHREARLAILLCFLCSRYLVWGQKVRPFGEWVNTLVGSSIFKAKVWDVRLGVFWAMFPSSGGDRSSNDPPYFGEHRVWPKNIYASLMVCDKMTKGRDNIAYTLGLNELQFLERKHTTKRIGKMTMPRKTCWALAASSYDFRIGTQQGLQKVRCLEAKTQTVPGHTPSRDPKSKYQLAAEWGLPDLFLRRSWSWTRVRTIGLAGKFMQAGHLRDSWLGLWGHNCA